MKKDLYQLMDENSLDALWISGPAHHNAAMRYFTGEGHLSQADLFLVKGKAPILFHSTMEREEAAQTGLETRDLKQYNLVELLKETDGDVVLAAARMYRKLLEDLALEEARIALYGKREVSAVWGVLTHLQKMLPALELIGEGRNSIMLQARATKDKEELERIREMGRRTTAVVAKVARFLQTRDVRSDEVLLDESQQPLTVQAVKTKINRWLAEENLENPEGVIFAQGRDAGIPHSAGTANDEIRLGKTIVFDIFPCEKGGGYFFDFTRTWCLGYAPEPAQQIYRDVKKVYHEIMSRIEPDQLASDLQEETCRLFEDLGHQTVRQDPKIEEGYVHSLGHGLGLDVHERPWFGRGATDQDRLSPGTVVTIEPGLYYPEQGMGCRIEDTVAVGASGEVELLGNFPYDLVLAMENASPTNFSRED